MSLSLGPEKFTKTPPHLDNFVLKKGLVPSGYVMGVGEPVRQFLGVHVESRSDPVDLLPWKEAFCKVTLATLSRAQYFKTNFVTNVKNICG